MPDPTAITIGNFDGVHRGHAELLRAARAIVGPNGRVIVLSFDPHPISVLRPDSAPARLTRWDDRVALLHAAGADEVVRLEPTRDVLSMQPDAFVAMLLERYQPMAIVEGADFRFGRGRAGSVQTLSALGDAMGFTLHIAADVDCELEDQSVVRVSSTLLRWLIGHGRVRDAARLLGRPLSLNGIVEKGEQRGRDLGCPTANLDTSDLLLPADGIYAGWAILENGGRYPAAISVGTKPTFGTRPRTCEAHLIGFDGPLDHYGWRLQLEITDWLRDQITYDSIDALVDQIHRDIADTMALVKGEPATVA